jgi:peptidoglycan/xylan/chitin deacetylase (PgdA/CDA1 family)
MVGHFLRRLKPYRRTPILEYHRVDEVSKEEDVFGLSVCRRSFERQMEYIRRRKRCVDLDGYVKTLERMEKKRPEWVVITFDDGYMDNYTNAWPILKKYGMAATFFIVTDLVGMTNEWDESRGLPRVNLLSWNEIRAMSSDGMRFGSHGCRHLRLTECSEEEVEKEVVMSKAVLEQKLKSKIRLFSFPYGDSNLTTAKIAKNAGYAAACSDLRSETEEFSIYSLSRIRILPGDSLALFKIKVSGWYDWIENVLTFVRIKGFMRRVELVRKRLIEAFSYGKCVQNWK